jgi:hypothetical protein
VRKLLAGIDAAGAEYAADPPGRPRQRRAARAARRERVAALADAEVELARREQAIPKTLTTAECAEILALGEDLGQVWSAATTTDKDRQQLLRALIEEVNITACRDAAEPHADIVLLWKGGAINDLTVPLRRPQPKLRTDEDTFDLTRRLAVHYPDATIAGILNRQGRRTARGLLYTASKVQSLRRHWGILNPSRQTVLQRVKRGELRAVLTRTGRGKDLLIKLPTPQVGLF